MAKKRKLIHISPPYKGLNYHVSPGTLLSEYLSVRGITQCKAAEIMGVSQSLVSKLINDKIRIGTDIAFKLESVLIDVKAEFWLDIDKHFYLAIRRSKL